MFGLYCTCRRRICPTVSTTSVASALGGKSIFERLYSTIWLADLGADCCRSKSAPADSANSAPSGGPALLPLRPASLTGISGRPVDHPRSLPDFKAALTHCRSG